MAAHPPLLEARGLRVTLPGDAGPVDVLDGVSLTLERGEVLDVVGPSGSGKSTLLRALARLLPGTDGALLLSGELAETIEAHEWRTRVALLPQKAAIVPGTIRDNLLLPWQLKVRAHAAVPPDDDLRAALDRVSLTDIDLDRDADRLSVGQAARVALTRVALTEPLGVAARRAGRESRRRIGRAGPDAHRVLRGGGRRRHTRSAPANRPARDEAIPPCLGTPCRLGGGGVTGAEAGGVIVIGWWQLALATVFVLVVGIISVRLALGIEKDLAIATVRTYLQLIALGLVLGWVFRYTDEANAWWLVILILLLMTATAAQIVLRRSPDAPAGVYLNSFASMLVTGFVVTFVVTGAIVQVSPWYRADYVIPIAGMVLGNSMNGIALALERVFADLDARDEEVLALTALGASPWEAAAPSIRSALRAGLMPTINSMAAVGIVFIPGMMAGQILAGADPLAATGYQIVVMLMVAAATAVGSMLAVLLTYKRRFTDDGVFIERGMRPEQSPRSRR